MSARQEDIAAEQPGRRRADWWADVAPHVLMALLGMGVVAAVATIPLAPRDQASLAGATILLFLIANRVAGPAMTVVLAAASCAVSLRYIVWRASDTLPTGSWLETALGAGLLLAEAYAILVMALSYVQMAWPLGRRPVPLPWDADSWPSVDVFIATFDEPLDIVRTTVLAAMAMDWPPDRLRVHLLDDGGREGFAAFAAQAGCGYLARAGRAHAKAGNLNAALAETDGACVAVFDCDHVPTRAFLQLTVGLLMADPTLAVVQTAQHFYTPDALQRNLAAGAAVPADGSLFHGMVQDGNDFWNAALFTGSCAVLRRQALAAIGGFAVESVTEDALTMLRLHRAGWHSAFVRAPLAAGLAAGTLARLIGQRRRWTRGMLQVLRLDNPLTGGGLSLAQLLCYAQACGYFLFAVPRVAFLSAPLAFLLFGQTVLVATPLAITAYALPHLALAVATRARLLRSWRHVVWSQVYETVLALPLLGVTVATLLSPRRGGFTVTPKATPPAEAFLDLGSVWPNLVLAGLLVLGIGRAVIGMLLLHAWVPELRVLLLNAVWAVLSLCVVLAAIAVGREARQTGRPVAIAASVPVVIRLGAGRAFTGLTRTLSREGALIVAEVPPGLAEGDDIGIEMMMGGEVLALPARLLRWTDAGLDLVWQPESLEDEAAIVRAVFGRADAWVEHGTGPDDRPLASLWSVLVSIGGLFRSGTRPAPPLAAGAGRGQLVGAAVVAAALLAGAPAWGQSAGPAAARPQVQSPARRAPADGMTVRVIPQPLPSFSLQPGGGAPLRVPPRPAAPLVPEAAVAPADAVAHGGSRRVVLSLRDLGAAGPLALRGTNQLQGVAFSVGADEVVTGAQLSLTGAMSPSLLPEFSNITVTLNGQYVATVVPSRDQPGFQTEMPISPVFFQDINRLNFRFTGRYTQDCNDPLSGLLWATVYDASTLTLTVERLPPRRDLSRLPRPFLDVRQKDLLTLPFVMAGNPGNDTLRAAGIVASWFGQLAGSRGATFPVVAEAPAEGNAVLLVVGGDAAGIAGLPPITGPTLAVVANPNDPLASLLLVAGRNGPEAATAATVLALGSRTLGGDTAVVAAPQVAPRVAYDAPAWIATDRPVRFGELVDAADLQSSGYVGLLHVPFRTAPDLYTWRGRTYAMDLRFHAPPEPVIDLAPSRLDVGINGSYLDTLSLAPGDRRGWLARLFAAPPPSGGGRVGIPAFDLAGLNDLQFYFDARPLHRGDCVAVPQDLRMSIDPDSTIDLRAGHRFAELPNLAFFASSGFPFTRMADLSETAVVLPERPGGVEVSAFLDVLGRLGALSGYPAIGVAVARPDGLAAVGDRDVLLIGTLARLQGAGDLLRGSAMRLDGTRLSIALSDPLDTVRRLFDARPGRERDRAAATLSAGVSESMAVLAGGESPLRAGHSVVALLAATPQALGGIAATLREGARAAAVQGDLVLFSGGRVSAFRVTRPYTVGSLPPWMWPGWVLGGQPYAVLLVMLVGSGVSGTALYWLLRRRAVRRPGADPADG